MRLRFIIVLAYSLWIVLGLVSLGALVFFWSNTHHNACIIICQYLGKMHRLHEFENQFLTLAQFKAVRYGLGLSTLSYVAVSYLVILKIASWADGVDQFLGQLSRSIKIKYGLFTPAQRRMGLVLISIFFLIKTYHISTIPISYDEAWTYLNFTSKSPLVTISYYPAPNNHILFTLATNVSAILPLPAVIALRLPNLILLPIAFIGFALMLREWFSANLSLLGSSMLVASYPVQLYSLQARGYLLYIFFGAVAFYTTYKLITSKSNVSKQFYKWNFIIACVLGFYVMPSFLYVLFSCGIYGMLYILLNKKWKKINTLFVSSIWILVCTMLLYTPVFLASGWQPVFNNPYVKRYSLSVIAENLTQHFAGVTNWLMGYIPDYGYMLVFVIICIGIILLFVSKESRKLLFYCLVFLLCPIIIVLLHRAIPFERTWSYTLFPLTIIFCALVTQFRQWIRVSTVTALLSYVGILSLGTLAFIQIYPSNYSIDYDANLISQRALTDNAHSFYIEEDYYEVLMYYHYTVRNQAYQVDNHQIGNGFDVEKNYDYLLLSSGTNNIDTTKYKSTGYGKYIKVFVKK